jgi:hypothetical protein
MIYPTQRTEIEEKGPRPQRRRCATGWMDEANDEISPRIGLPYLPVIDWPDFSYADLAALQQWLRDLK